MRAPACAAPCRCAGALNPANCSVRASTRGAAQYPPHGIPFYLRETLPRYMLHFMPQPAAPAAAARIAERNIAQGADILKLFTGSYVERDRILPMPEGNAKAAAAVAHQHGQLVYSHPSNLSGVLVAMHSGVDVLAHAPDTPDGIDEALLQSMVDKRMAMIPTLKMFATTVTTKAAYLDPIYASANWPTSWSSRLIRPQTSPPSRRFYARSAAAA